MPVALRIPSSDHVPAQPNAQIVCSPEEKSFPEAAEHMWMDFELALVTTHL